MYVTYPAELMVSVGECLGNHSPHCDKNENENKVARDEVICCLAVINR